MKVLLVNASAPAYNLGLAKARHYWRARGAVVEQLLSVPTLLAARYDAVWVSAIFSWHVPRAIEFAEDARRAGCAVDVGGPGMFGLRPYVRARLGQDAQATPDPRFEMQPGHDYRAVFWSRGCPAKNCTLGFPRGDAEAVCSVPAMEGWRFSFYPEATPAPVILDNNLSALPREYQEHVVRRTAAAGFARVDANSGFEPRSIRADTIALWRQLPLVAWRFAYDELAERPAVTRALALFDAAGISRRALRIYCLAGNEPIDACEQRVREIASWKCTPIVQRRRPLDWIGGPLPTLHDWSAQTLVDFQRWGNRLAKGGMPFREYRRNMRDRHAHGPMFDRIGPAEVSS